MSRYANEAAFMQIDSVIHIVTRTAINYSQHIPPNLNIITAYGAILSSIPRIPRESAENPPRISENSDEI